MYNAEGRLYNSQQFLCVTYESEIKFKINLKIIYMYRTL